MLDHGLRREAKVGVANMDKQNRKSNMLYWTVSPQQVLQLASEFVNVFLNPLKKSFKLGQFEKHKC